MAYRLCDPKVLQAVDRIIRDVDKRYDECLVDRFLEFIELTATSDANDTNGERLEDYKAVLDHIKYFTDHKAFVMLNQSRALKTFYSVLKSNKLTDRRFNDILPHLSSLWSTLDCIIINDNLSAMTAMLSIFIHLSCSESGHQWLMSQVIEPPLRLSNSHLKDVINLVEYFLDCKNYHTKNKVEKLFEHLISNTKSDDFMQKNLIEKLICDLLLKGSTSMVHILNSIRTKGHGDLDRYNIVDSLHSSFEMMIEQSNFMNFCRCLASMSSLSSSHIETCKRSAHLKGLIIYLSCFDDDKSLAYLLYPLLSRCIRRDNAMLEEKLDLSADEKMFIRTNMKKSIIFLCLAQLNQMNSYRNAKLVIDSLVEYIRCHWNSIADYKDVMECCSVLIHVLERCILSDDNSLDLLNTLHHTLSDITFSEQTKPIMMRLLKILQTVHSSCSQINNYECEKLHLRTLDLASRTNDHDILDEFLQFFRRNPFDFNRNLKYTKKYIDFVWKQVYLNAKDTEHRELLGNLVYLLVDLDIKVESSTFLTYGIKHHHDIPNILSDLLINRFAILPTVELVIEALDNEDFQLDIECVDRLVQGLQIAIKSEASGQSRLKAFEILCGLSKKFSAIKSDIIDNLKGYIELSEETDEKLELHSMVDDILNYDLISDGILDCY